MNSNKTSLKSQLIRLGLIVPLALVSVGVYADAAADAAAAAANDELIDSADFGTKADTETDFSVDPFAVPAGSADGANGDELAAQKLEKAFFITTGTGAEAKTSITTLGQYFAGAIDAGRELINFQTAGVTDGVVSVQAGGGSGTVIIKDGTNLADLTLSGKAIVLGTGTESSPNGADKLVLGAFGGYGAIGFDSKFHATFDKDGKETTDATEKAAFKPSVVAQSSGFGGGLFATYKADADSPLGFSVEGKIRYTKMTHLFTTKKIESLVTTVAQAAVPAVPAVPATSTAPAVAAVPAVPAVPEASTDKIVKTYYGYKNGAVNGDLGVGYALQVAEVAGFPIIVQGTAKVAADYDKFEKDAKDDKVKGVVLVSQKFGLNLCTALLDGKLSAAIGAKLSKTAALASQGQEFAGIPARQDQKFSKFLVANLGYRFNDTISIGFGGEALVPEKAKAGEENKPGTMLGLAAVGFGLNYRF